MKFKTIKNEAYDAYNTVRDRATDGYYSAKDKANDLYERAKDRGHDYAQDAKSLANKAYKQAGYITTQKSLFKMGVSFLAGYLIAKVVS